MFGSIDEWFYRSLLGINPAAPGFKKVVIKPQPAGGISWAKGNYQSVMGTIRSEWKITNGQFSLNISIPVNTSALVFIPSKPNATVQEDNKSVNPMRYEKGYAVVEVGSGNYTFSTDWNRSSSNK